MQGFLRPKWFTWKNRDETDVGLIAEDVEKVIPELVTYKDGRVEGVKYDQFTVYLLDVVKQQDRSIKELKSIVCGDHPEADACRNRD